MDIAELLAFSVKNKASDLHISAGLPPMIRVDGDIYSINEDLQLDPKKKHTIEIVVDRLVVRNFKRIIKKLKSE